MDDTGGGDICRVCRCESTPDRALFHPCICTGSIKWIHQDCLMQWMRYSRKEYCELCSHRFSFTPIYSPDMPRRLPLRDVIGGLLSSVGTAVKYWLHYTLVAAAWLGVVPLTSCRIYRALFTGSVESIMTLPLDMINTNNIPADVFHGCFVLACTLFSFIGVVWLREQIVNGGGPEWLEDQPLNNNNNNNNVNNNNNEDAAAANAEGNQPADDAAGDGRAENGVVGGDRDFRDRPVDNVPVGGGAAVEDAQGDRPPVDMEGRDDGNWNPMDWDHPGEELTWERLLGLDGSLMFLEHVFWVIWLNTLFILVFAFCPHYLGHFALLGSGLQQQMTQSHFSSLLTTLIGYIIVCLFLLFMHAAASLFGLRQSRRFIGLCYVIIKVSLLAVVEIGLLPLVCGWWLDICSLSLFDASLKDRETSFQAAPGASLFIHWLVGMVYVYYFASFVLLLREVLRPGVLWFLVNLNDPDFSPIQEMIHLPILHHIRRLLVSSVVFGTAVLLMLWLPIRMLRHLWPTFLPYTVSVQSETMFNELSLELLLLQVILPALLEQSHTRIWMKSLVRLWCRSVAWLLGLQSYLLGDEWEDENSDASSDAGDVAADDADPAPVFNDLGAVHQALIPREQRIGVQPYQKPQWFQFRLLGLLVAVALSLVVASLAALTVPVWLGRQVMALWVVGVPAPSPLIRVPPIGDRPTRVHELYTVACGTYMCWLTLRGVALVRAWLPHGRAAFTARMRQWCVWGVKSVVAFSVLLGLIPVMFGLLLELVVVIPFRVSLEQTPVFFLWQDWALGVLYTKIACAIVIMGPEWRMRRAIERAYRDGIRNMDLLYLMEQVAFPVTVVLGMCLAVPYVVAHSLVPLLVTSAHVRNLVARRLYPYLLVAALAITAIVFQIRQFRKLYEHIKNDKYLVGRRLVNYHHRHKQKALSN